LICPKCKVEMRVAMTLNSPAGKVQRLVCSRKGCPVTLVGVVLVLQEVTKKGTGVHAVMKKLKAGKIKVNLLG
jgi:hypothetical protein